MPGRQQVVCSHGPQTVGGGERLVEVTRVETADRGQLMHDHVGLGLGDRVGDLLGVQRVRHDRGSSHLPDRVLLGFAAGHADDVVAGRHQPRDQLRADRARCTCEKDLHFGSLA
jgi:hypothetical protein